MLLKRFDCRMKTKKPEHVQMWSRLGAFSFWRWKKAGGIPRGYFWNWIAIEDLGSFPNTSLFQVCWLKKVQTTGEGGDLGHWVWCVFAVNRFSGCSQEAPSTPCMWQWPKIISWAKCRFILGESVQHQQVFPCEQLRETIPWGIRQPEWERHGVTLQDKPAGYDVCDITDRMNGFRA